MNSVTSWINECPTTTAVLAAFGGITLLSFTLKFLQFFAQTFLFGGISLNKFGAKKNAWAVVTGATDGIGREFALQLAKAGFNIVLASRTQAKLDAVASEIASKYNKQTKVVVIDFSKRNKDQYDTLARTVSGLDVGVLVNNVGVSHAMPVYFAEAPQQEIDDILEVNIYANVAVTKIVLPIMEKRKNGLVLNIGSFSSSFATPMLTTYSASKSFLSTFSQTLANEYERKGIVVQLVNTFFVVSNMSKIRRPTMMTPTAKTYVASVLGKIGNACGAVGVPYTSTPYYAHAVYEFILRRLAMYKYFMTYGHNMQKIIRVKALKKQERESKKET